ncbi:MAG: ABC transporter permease [Anaerolineae bacterium]|nr:ABC transporter permease [Anaerolineae bacterium]
MIILETLAYISARWPEFLEALGQHLIFVGVALGVGIALCVPLGVLTSRSKVAAATIVNIFNTLRVIPSLAILFLAIPYFGLSFTSAVIALTILALPPILINTDAAFRTIEPAVKEAAQGMGMTAQQILWRVEFPLALPVIIAGVRTATVEVIASATLAAFVGGGGLGLYVSRGFALYDTSILLAGAVPVAALALLAEVLLSALQRAVEPPSPHRKRRPAFAGGGGCEG